jgi:hypothetical protein
VEWHLLKDCVISGECRVDYGKVPLVGEVEEVHLHFPTRLPIEDFCIPGHLSGNLKSAA